MSSVNTSSPAAAYLTKANIIHPASEVGSGGDATVTAAEVQARIDIADHLGGATAITISGGTIRKGR